MPRGGARPGAGRKPGSRNAETLERDRVLRAFRERVQRHADDLFNAQFSVARGVSYVYRIDRQGEREVHNIVTDPEEIKRFLDGSATDTFYYITTEKPDNKAIDSLLDRTFGKAAQAIEMSGPDGEALPVALSYDFSSLTTSDLRNLRDILTRITPAAAPDRDGAGDTQPN